MADATGGTISYSGGYTIHTFTSNGTLVVPGTGLMDYLIVGGGGSVGGGQNGSWFAGGGGGGQVLHAENTVLTQGTYAIVVGATTTDYNYGPTYAGNASSFYGLTANGGSPGFGTGDAGTNGDGTHTGGTGNNGGYWGGGGGGATANGTAGNSGPGGSPGAGGAGYTSSITGSPVEYGKGGDAGFGTGNPPTANIGIGGKQEKGAGGSGVVIVRYLTNSLVSGGFWHMF